MGTERVVWSACRHRSRTPWVPLHRLALSAGSPFCTPPCTPLLQSRSPLHSHYISGHPPYALCAPLHPLCASSTLPAPSPEQPKPLSVFPACLQAAPALHLLSNPLHSHMYFPASHQASPLSPPYIPLGIIIPISIPLNPSCINPGTPLQIPCIPSAPHCSMSCAPPSQAL